MFRLLLPYHPLEMLLIPKSIARLPFECTCLETSYELTYRNNGDLDLTKQAKHVNVSCTPSCKNWILKTPTMEHKMSTRN